MNRKRSTREHPLARLRASFIFCCAPARASDKIVSDTTIPPPYPTDRKGGLPMGRHSAQSPRNGGATTLGCEDFRRTLRLDRRGFVKAGVLGTAGLCLSDLLRLEAGTTAPKR